MHNITVKLEKGRAMECAVGTVVGTLADSSKAVSGLPYVGALVNNDVYSMAYPLAVNSEVKYLTAEEPNGWRIYRNSLCFLLAKAVHELYPKALFRVEHSFGLGLYCSFSADSSDYEGYRVS